MKGRNSIKMNLETMNAAIQYYLNNVLFKGGQGVKVTEVSEVQTMAGGEGFNVEIEETQSEKPESST